MSNFKTAVQALKDWEGGGANVEYTYPGIQVALLWRISQQLYELLNLCRCPNVARGFIAMKQVEGLLRARLKPRPRRKRKKTSV